MNKKIISDQLIIQGKEIQYKFKTSNHSFISDNKNYSNLNNIYIKIDLPAIYSSSERSFKWIKYIGYNIIDKIHCKIYFNNNQQELNLYTYSEWLYIWYEMNLNESEKKLHYELIGHIPELYDPMLNNNNIYPASHLEKQKYKWLIDDNNINKASIINIDNDFNFNKPPSINNRTIYIPLNFSFVLILIIYYH